MRLHSRILDRSSTPIWPPRKIFQGRNYANDVIFIDHVLNPVPRLSLLCLRNEVAMCFVSCRSPVSRLPRVLVCFLVEFDLFFAFGVLSCRILDSASLFILYMHEHDHLGFGMLTVETALFHCICWFSSSCDRKGQSYPVEYCLESVEEYSEGRVHKSEPRNEKGNFEIIATGKSDLQCKIKETLLISELKPSLNENVGSEKLFLY